jgi:hypothetical protein
MKMQVSYEELVNSGKYQKILQLPSYVVWQNSEDFHTVLFFVPKTRSKTLKEPQMLGQYNIPGLSTDPDILIPSGMWREWLKGVKKTATSILDEVPNLQNRLNRLTLTNPPPTPPMTLTGDLPPGTYVRAQNLRGAQQTVFAPAPPPDLDLDITAEIDEIYRQEREQEERERPE